MQSPTHASDGVLNLGPTTGTVVDMLYRYDNNLMVSLVVFVLGVGGLP